jgi:predicted ester cyclase
MNKPKTLFILVSFFLIACKINSTKKEKQIAMKTENNISNNTLAIVEKFNAAFNKHDVQAVMNIMTDDCVLAVRAYWEKFFTNNPDAFFETEDVFSAGDRCLVRWIYRKTKDGKLWHLRGVDVFKVRDGKVAEKLAYVKG